MTVQRRIRGVLFDLDGTLVDTAPDMGGALNELLVENGRAALPAARIRPVVSHGSPGLLELGFGVTQDDARFEPLKQRFLDLYEARICRASRPFAGADAVLRQLAASGRRWGIVTNKPGWLARPLVRALGLSKRSECLISGDCLPRRKPHPDPLLHAADLLETPPQACVYIGDAERDIEAGRAAGMATLVAAYGYLRDEDTPERWGADGMLDDIAGLADWLAASDAADDTVVV